MLRRLRQKTLGLATAALVCGGASGSSLAEGPPSTIIISDTSGSMEGFLGTEGRRHKYEVAREALRASLAKVSPKNRIGLMAFGHRQKGCSDVELIVPPDAGPPDRIMAPLERIKPIGGRGTGPLALALREAQKALVASGPATGPQSIIVVHDGADNCGQDLCAAAADLSKTGSRIAVHLVALDLKKPDLAKVACIPRLTGGKMFEVYDPAAADSAIAEAVKLALLDQTPPEPEPEAEAAPPPPPAPTDLEGPPRIRLSASLAPNTPALTQPLVWKLVMDGAAEATPLERTAAEIFEPLAAGKYKLEVRYGLVITTGTIEVAEKGLSSIRVPLNAGTIRIAAKAARSGAPLTDALITVLRKDEGDQATSGAPVWIGRSDAEIVVPAGTYDVKLEDDLVHAAQTVTLAPGGRVVSEFSPGLGYLRLSATAIEGGPAVSGASFIIAVDDPDAPLGRREIARSAHPEPAFTLPAGTYYVTARFGDSEIRQRVAVGPGDTVQRAISLGLANIEVNGALEMGEPPQGEGLVHRVLTLDAESREVARSSTNPARFSLPAGRYRVETMLGNENVRTTTDVEVQPGKDGKIVQRLAAGRVTIKPPQGPAGASGTLAAWEVRDSRGHVVWRAGHARPTTTLLAPGHYVARSETIDQAIESPFDLKSGEQQSVDLAAP